MSTYTPQTIVEGRNLMLFDSTGASYAYATNHTLSIQANTADISSKDHGIWTGASVQNYSWTITSENLATDEYDTLFAAMIAGTPITVKFGLKSQNDPDKTVADGDYENWTLDTNKVFYSGSVIITSLELNAPNGEKANYSLELQGVGKLEQNTPN